MKINKFKENSKFEDFKEIVKDTFSFLIDEGCKIYYRGNEEAFIYYDVPPLNKEINENIDNYINWVDKISNIANDMKISAERLKYTQNISYHFYNKVELNRSRISITISIIDDSIIRKENNGHIDYLVINLPRLRSEFNIPEDIDIKVEWWNNSDSAAYSLNFKRINEYGNLIKFLSEQPDYVSHHITKAKTLIVRFKAKHINLIGK